MSSPSTPSLLKKREKSSSEPKIFKTESEWHPETPSHLLSEALLTKATAFTEEERDRLGLRGLLPSVPETMEGQVARALNHLRSFDVPINKYTYLSSLKARNETLFYRLLIEHLEEIMPLVYTPTVGDACMEFGHNFRTAEGMYFNKNDKGRMREMLDNWPHKNVRIIVVTDGSRILGLGDLGANGMGIPIGKLSLYVAASGFHPGRTLPVTLDLGTNTTSILEDPLYLGMRHKRLPDDEYYPLVEEFVMAVKDKWPACLIQFEDFSNNHCFELLERYRKRVLCFNDDIQGTGAVVAAGYLNAVKLSGLPMSDQRLVFLGAGSAGIGVADAIVRLMVETGMDMGEARKRFWLVDSRGLVTTNRGDRLAPHKVPYARTDNGDQQYTSLGDTVAAIKPTTIIGLAGLPGGSFTPEIIRMVGDNVDRPIIFALSNPTKKAECTAEQAYTHTNGRAIFASGSPFDPVEYGGKTYIPGQGNNMYIFPGLGFGAVICGATEVTDGMIATAAKELANQTTEEELAAGRIYPQLDRIRDISAHIAAAVAEKAYEEGLAMHERPENLLDYTYSRMYFPDYPTISAL